MKITAQEIDNKKILMTPEFRPITDLVGKKIFRYLAVPRFLNIKDPLITPQIEPAKLDEPNIAFKIGDFIFDAIFQTLEKRESVNFALNLPPQRLNDMDYLATLKHQCLLKQVQPQRIEIGINIKSLSNNLAASLPFLNKAKAYGFMLSLDEYDRINLPVDIPHFFRFDSLIIKSSFIQGVSTDIIKQTQLKRLISKLTCANTALIVDGATYASDLKFLTERYIHNEVQILHRAVTYSHLQLIEDFQH